MHILMIPDLFLLLLGALILFIDLLHPYKQTRISFHICWSGLVFLLLITLSLPYDQSFNYLNTYIINGTSLLFRLLFITSALFTVLLSDSYFARGGNVRGQLKHRNEFHIIIIFATFGMFAVVSATNLLTLFIGMELATIPLYILSAYQKNDHLSVEASSKYIIMGSLSTGLMLFGFSFLYGCAGSLDFESIRIFAEANTNNQFLIVGTFFILVATGFKLTLFPFHMWAPDVYEGSPTPVTAFISVSSKTTAVAFLLILLFSPLSALQDMLIIPLLMLAGATMTIGNLGALRQRNLRRFMAYSSIAQAGYIVMAMVGTKISAYSSIIYYLLVYAVANYLIFFIISIVGQRKAEIIPSLRGMGKQNPVIAAILMLTMFSLAGIPPLAGFMGKFLLFSAAAEKGYYGMVIFAALNSTVSLYYYLLLVKEAYIIKPQITLPPLTINVCQRISLYTLTTAIIILGVVPIFSTLVIDILR